MESSKPEPNPKKKPVNKVSALREWAQIVATSLIAVVGLVFTYVNSHQEDQNRRYATATQLMSGREESETNFRQTMFQPLINQILDDSLPLEKRVTVFALFQNNFNDLFNSRILFDALSDEADREIEAGDCEASAIKKRLVSLARRTNENEEFLLSVGEDAKQYTYSKKGSDTVNISFNDEKSDGDENQENIKVFIDSVYNDAVEIRMCIMIDNDSCVWVNNSNSFLVSYYDSPFTDNVMVSDGDRIAVILKEIKTINDTNYATIKVIHFPGDFITTGYRPSFQKVQDLLNKKS